MTGGFLLFIGIISEAKNILLSIKKDTEILYRQFYFKNDINVTRNVIAFTSLIPGLYTKKRFSNLPGFLDFFCSCVEQTLYAHSKYSSKAT
jgi:hypothetical protein